MRTGTCLSGLIWSTSQIWYKTQLMPGSGFNKYPASFNLSAIHVHSGNFIEANTCKDMESVTHRI